MPNASSWGCCSSKAPARLAPQRIVTMKPPSGGASRALWRALPSGACLEERAWLRLEMSGGQAACHLARRAGHRPLEALPMAGDKKAPRLGPHLAFLNESGLLLRPTRWRTWALAGSTPIPGSPLHACPHLHPGCPHRVAQAPAYGSVPPVAAEELPGCGCGGLPAGPLATTARPCRAPLRPGLHSHGSCH